LVCSTLGYPLNTCPLWMEKSGILKDLSILSEAISMTNSSIYGICDEYTCLEEVNGLFETRMRIYRNTQGDKYIVFRPTQQTPLGVSIHNDRELVPCQFLGEFCSGLVLDKFQNAFLSLINSVTTSYWDSHQYIYITGHSLGGSFSVMLGVYLFHLYDIQPRFILYMAGPFFADSEFNKMYLEPLGEIMRDGLCIMEDVNLYNMSEFDGTVEDYNTPNSPFINVEQKMLCGAPIYKLSDSYGMHDLRNYQLFFQEKDCLLIYGD